MAEGVLEVEGVPPTTEEELVVLYFESRRRSGGGPVQSCQRLGPLLFLTFENAQDAQNVLARGSHRLGGVELGVRPAPPWDPGRLLVQGLGPQTPPELLELHLETLLRRPRGAFGLCRGPAPGWALLRLWEPITPREFAAAEQRAQQQGLEGPALALLRLPQTASVLVRAKAPGLNRDLLELYFENWRSGGGSVRAVRLLPGGRAAVVTFQELAAAERVLQRPHRLQDMALALTPHYPFLERLEGDADPRPDMAIPPDTAPLLDTAPAPPPDTAPSLDTAPAPPPDTAPSLDTAPPPDADLPPDMAAPPDVAPPAPASPDARLEVAEPAGLQALSRVPGELSAAFPGGDKDAERDEDAAGRGQRQEQAALVLAGSAQDEALVPAEPGALRYLQRHYQDLLASIPEVSLLPLEGEDVAGFRVSGETGRCRAAADFLQSLLGTVGSQPVTLRFPGVARFLRDEGGQSILRQLESRFQCVIDLDGVHWSPPDPQPELVELLPPSCRRDPLPTALRSWHRNLPGDADGAAGADDADGDGLHSNIEEIKELLAALRPGEATGDGEPAPQHGDVPGWEQDPAAKPPAAADGEGTGETLLGGQGARVEEEAQMVLAIQRSMDNTRREEEELARATALSLRSYCQEQRAAPGAREEEEEEEDAGLLAALEASLEEALPAADTARVTLFSSFERDVAAVPRELEQALEGWLRAEEVESERLRALPAACRRCLTFLQRKHAVRLCLRGSTATLHGFAEYTAAAARDLALLLQRLPQLERDPATPAAAAVHWVRWDPSGTAVPYAPEAAALLERAWLRRERRVDLLLDGRPFTVDFERMEEYDISNACALAVSRSRPPTESAHRLLGPEALSLEEEVRLMPLAEDSEEFCDTVRHFYEMLEELHGKISVVKYQLKKASMEKACAGGVVERVLFHGTTETSSREICLHGFNRSFCGKNAALYGLGVYFAVHAAVSVQEQYSPSSADGSKYVFVAKVLTGEYAVGRQGLRAPPLREGAGAPLRYDSVVDNPLQPAIFVIFNDTQAYPQYLITCRRRGAPP
ncbi:protein mono-ADP-ribosyltransferase PARP10 isoform X2 [Calonectris borealis]|uniref:protein mono-ADP-ribosyltransferase PARP10 isoform X2 n=1 Tax=Calonectris borealis TaxID=1323832 RepID=UPI003F4B7818